MERQVIIIQLLSWKTFIFPFSSDTWDLVPEDIRHQLLRVKDDGEFWMAYEDFVTCYTLLEFCHPNPDSLKVAQKEMQHWKSFMIDGAWVSKVTSGGAPNDKSTHYQW